MENATLWGFLCVITLSVFGVIGQQIQAKKEARIAKEKASVAASNSQKAVDNTKSVSNGFATRMDDKLDMIIRKLDRHDRAIREHLEWHLEHRRRRDDHS